MDYAEKKGIKKLKFGGIFYEPVKISVTNSTMEDETPTPEVETPAEPTEGAETAE